MKYYLFEQEYLKKVD